MAKPASSLAEALHSHARGLDRYLDRLEGELRAGRLSRRDVTRAYGGAFLSFYVRLEDSVEALFMGLLMGRLTVSRSGVRPLVQINSELVARNVVRGGRPFVDWLPITSTKERAKAFLSGGRPFALMTPSDVEALEDARIIRNAIAHSGSHAAEKFRSRFTSGRPLPPDQISPAGYLRGMHTLNQTRFNYVIAECVLAIRSLCR